MNASVQVPLAQGWLSVSEVEKARQHLQYKFCNVHSTEGAFREVNIVFLKLLH